ncbi:hypothetical protein [Streptomyces sp. H51]|nr:hypothetical protein [Streptomyces sp. H51]
MSSTSVDFGRQAGLAASARELILRLAPAATGASASSTTYA